MTQVCFSSSSCDLHSEKIFGEKRFKKMSERFRRKTPEEILSSIAKVNRGRFIIFLGAVSGSGKTYHMLMEGNRLKKKGVDVVLGVIVDSHHPDTSNQIGVLEIIPSIRWDDHGKTKFDLNIEYILARKPEVILVDELAHRNHERNKNATRLDDVMELIDYNISVITTVNIYELEGVKKVAEKLTGIKVKVDQCVPENTLAQADEVKLVDVTPESILKRIQEGSIINSSSKTKKRESLFHRNNLAVLRELSLRVLAGEVNEDLDDYREKHGLVGASGASERILVMVQYHWTGSSLIRKGQQLAKRLGAEIDILCIRSGKNPLSKDEITFKRSMEKLAEKIGAHFEELPSLNEKVSDQIIEYAMQKNSTRIVIGQSKRSRLEEMIYGSITNKILRKTKNVDLLIVADLAEKEHVIPTKIHHRHSKLNSYKRLSPLEIEEVIHKIKRGTLSIYIGSAPGVGKTYKMLIEANKLKEKGIDVVIGLLETHEREETIEQIGQLEIIPRKEIFYKNVKLSEMDTVAIINRNPEVVLVDELAHTNIPGSKYVKRYEDVNEILEAGISVISTMNIQHLESLNDSVEQITGVRVKEVIPDHILKNANEIELIDISPITLRQRMREGNIYKQEKIEQSLKNFFKKGNLIALRELALREVAYDVDDRMDDFGKKGVQRELAHQEIITVV